MLKLLVPEGSGICRIAAAEFASLWRRVAGEEPPVVFEDDPACDLVVLGSDAVNAFSHACIMRKVVPGFGLATGTDAYRLVSAGDGGRTLLFLAGARLRALLYAVYRFFELRAGCRYFWDGDVVPRRERIDLGGLDVREEPRFRYRGLRYFAHRGLDRFQAEHWDFEDWRREIDWILKKRLNLFMLRIGLDDLFQQAFPGVVHYPEGYEVPEAVERSYDDRRLFWSLRFRGELRRRVLAYARERDLLHPEDVGTMTHWYSRTPLEYLDRVRPAFLPQATSGYSERTGLVWDIRRDGCLDAYWKLTETHIEKYGSPDIFHTIGLAERRCFDDRESNHRMKLYAYRRIIARLRERHPNSPLLLGTWDFAMYWTPQEVRSLVRELDPANTLVLDYTSDTPDDADNFLTWGLCGRFPWVYGIFHAYEPASEIRGNYDRIEERLPLAAADPMCQGLVYWPECSHTDTLMLEFMSRLAWDPSRCRIDDFLPVFCRDRYPEDPEEMAAVWREVLPLARLVGWPGVKTYDGLVGFADVVFDLLDPRTSELDADALHRHGLLARRLEKEIGRCGRIFRMLADRCRRKRDGFVCRDLLDLARTAVSRLQAYAVSTLCLAAEDWRNRALPAEGLLARLDGLGACIALERDLLGAHEDYSLWESLQRLRRKHETNPDFEAVLKGNAEDLYCRSYVYELFDGVYLPEFGIYSDWMKAKVRADDRSPWRRPEGFDAARKAVRDRFHAAPLRELAPDRAAAEERLPETLAALAAYSDEVVARRGVENGGAA